MLWIILAGSLIFMYMSHDAKWGFIFFITVTIIWLITSHAEQDRDKKPLERKKSPGDQSIASYNESDNQNPYGSATKSREELEDELVDIMMARDAYNFVKKDLFSDNDSTDKK